MLFDNNSQANFSSQTTWTMAHNNQGNAIALVLYCQTSQLTPPTQVTYNGVNMVAGTAYYSGFNSPTMFTYYLLNAPVGNNSFSVTWSTNYPNPPTGETGTAMAISVKGVDKNGSVGQANNAQSGANPSDSLSGVLKGSFVFDFLQSFFSPTAASGQTVISSGSYYIGYYIAPSAGTQTMAWTATFGPYKEVMFSFPPLLNNNALLFAGD